MKAISDSVHNVLSKNNYSFYIPPFQRSYSWGEAELERYFHDVIRIVESELDPNQKDKLEHFFGTIVLKEEEISYATKAIIIDGQQRLTTTLIFLIALRDIEDSNEKKKFINQNYLFNNSSPFEHKIKLKQVTKDWQAYQSIIHPKDKLIEGNPITQAYKYFKKLIQDKKSENPKIQFDHYILAVRRMNVAVIYLDERPHKGEDPQVIFETLNSLGKPLTLSDLIRNYILLQYESSKQDEIYDKYWYKKIEEVLKEYTSHFFRDYLQYKMSIPLKVVNQSNAKELYHHFKEYVEDNYKNHIDDFVHDIIKYVILYKWIVFEVHNDLISNDLNYDLKLKELLKDIFHHIKTEAFKPFVLGLLEYYYYGKNNLKISEKSLISMLETIRIYLIRRRILGLTQGENKDIVKLCRKIPELAENKITMLEILTNLFYKLRLPNDGEIEEHLKEIHFDKELKNYAKFILVKIEEHNSKVKIDLEDSKLVIEHIMPVKLNLEWKKELGERYQEIHDKYLHNIGNIILTDLQKELANFSFAEKKKVLAHSKLYYKKAILDKDQWNEESILEHQKTMIKWFLETFPLPEEYKNKNNWNQNLTDVLIISPLEDYVEEIARGEVPIQIQIFDQSIYVETWQDVLIEFLNFIKKDPKYDFESILSRQDELFGRKDVIIKGSDFKIKASKKPVLLNRYKSYDGKIKKSIREIDDDEYYIHVNISSETCLERIANMMNLFKINEKEVRIMLEK